MKRTMVLFTVALCLLLICQMASAQALTGTYYVPKGTNPQGFSSLNAAFAAVNANGLSGNTTILIDGNLVETDTLELYRSDLSATKTLTIKPNVGKKVTVSIKKGTIISFNSARGSAIYVYNTPYVTFDGSNTVGGTTRDLTIIDSLGTLGYATVGFLGKSNYGTVKNITFLTSIQQYYGITTDGFVSGVDSLAPQKFLLDNCSLGTSALNWQAGVGLFGNVAGLYTNATVQNCTIFTARRGITTFYISKCNFTGNTISIATPLVNSTFYSGIYITGGDALDTTNIVGNKVPLIEINASSVRFASPVVMYGYTGVVNIVNNMFAPNFSNASATKKCNYYGVALGGFWAGTCNMYYNTIRMNASSDTGYSACVGFDKAGWTEATTPTLTVKNNIFVHEKNDTSAYGLYHWTTKAPLASDFNNIKVGANAYTGNYQGTKTKALTDWQLASFQDINSKAVAVNFVSATDLRLIGTSVGDANLKGTPIPGWTKDINGNTRNTTKPYMGADESQGQPSAVLLEGTVPTQFELSQNYPNPFNPSTQIRFTITREGATTLKVYDMMGREITTLVNETLVPGTYNAKFDAARLSSGTYIYVLTSGGKRLANKMLLLK